MSHHTSSQFYNNHSASSSALSNRQQQQSNHHHHEPKRILLHRKSKEKPEEPESPATPDSTTEPPKPAHDFQEGDDVFFKNDEGQNILGTVGQVTPLKVQVLFGDGTQQWATYRRLKKLSCAFDPPSQPSSQNCVDDSTSARVSEYSNDKNKNEIPCVICKTNKKVSSKKIGTYNEKNPFKCARCTALKAHPVSPSTFRKYSTSQIDPKKAANSVSRQLIRRPNSVTEASSTLCSNHVRTPPKSPAPGARSVSHANTVSGGGKGPSIGVSPVDPNQRLRSPSGSPPMINGLSPGMTVKPVKNSYSVQLKTSPIKSSKNNACFHCGERTVPYDRVHCNMCERYCHLLCLALTPPPLEGDKFWDVMCSACGTQNGSEKSPSKVFSVRRNINSWSDVVHLIINCLKVKNMGQQYFDFESQILPFLDANMDKLHLPRQYKSVSREERKNKLLAALQDSRLRFTKHKDKLPSPMGGHETTFWALRSDQSKSNPTSPEVTPMRPFPTTSKSLTISPLNPNSSSIHRGATTSNSDSTNNTSSDSSGLSVSPNSPLPLSLKNRTTASPGSSPALSIFPIPNPNYSSSSSGMGSSFNGSASTPGSSFPRVASKDALLRSPVTTNVRLSSSTSVSTSVVCQSKTQSINTTPKKTSEAPSSLAKDQNTKKLAADDKNGQRQRLRIRLPVKQPDKADQKEASKSDSPDVKKKQLQLPGKFPPPGTTMQPRPPLAGPAGRKRVLSSDEEDDVALPKKVHTSDSTPEARAASGIAIKSASTSVERSPVKPGPAPTPGSPSGLQPPISPLRLTIPKGRQKLLRSSVLKNKLANNKNGKLAGRGRGRGGVKILSPLRKEHFPGYHTPHMVVKNGQSDSGKAEATSQSNGNQKSENGRIVKVKVKLPPPPAVLPAAEGESSSGDCESNADELKAFKDNLLSAVLHNDLRINCLPNDKPGKCTVARLLRQEAEKQNSLSDEEIENHPGWGRRDPLMGFDMPGKKRRDLADQDSYEVVASKTGPDGVRRYLVVWREPTRDGEKDFDEEIERLFFNHEKSRSSRSSSTSSSFMVNGIKEERDVKPPLTFSGLIHSEEKIKLVTALGLSQTCKPSSSKTAMNSSGKNNHSNNFLPTANNKLSVSSGSKSTPSPSRSSSNSNSPSKVLPCVIDLTDSP